MIDTIKYNWTIILVCVIISVVVGIIIFEEVAFPSEQASTQGSQIPQVQGEQENRDDISFAIAPGDYYRGNRDAKIVFIEYSDLECPYCKRFHSTMKQVIDGYGDHVLWAYRHFPLGSHPNAQKASEAAECVGKYSGDNAFWEFTDLYFSRTTSNGYGFPTANLAALATEVGADQGTIQGCIDSGEMVESVASDFQAGIDSGVTGTPGTILIEPDGQSQVLSGAIPYEQMKQIIESSL